MLSVKLAVYTEYRRWNEHIYNLIKKLQNTIKYIYLAAEHGEPIAHFIQGDDYLDGERIEQDYSKAVHYFTLAAEQNYSGA